MRYVYAHFPINVNIEKDKDSGLYEVEIRYVNFLLGKSPGNMVWMLELGLNERIGIETSYNWAQDYERRLIYFGSNFIGEKIVRKVIMHQGVDVEPSKNQKDELQLSGISLENVSQSAADLQQICRVRNKDIRKVSLIHLQQEIVN